jgi:hypothetical protein
MAGQFSPIDQNPIGTEIALSVSIYYLIINIAIIPKTSQDGGMVSGNKGGVDGDVTLFASAYRIASLFQNDFFSPPIIFHQQTMNFIGLCGFGDHFEQDNLSLFYFYFA